MAEKQAVSSSTTIAAAPATVYTLVSDLTRMGEWSPEAAGGQWLGDVTGPAVGARFKGTNENGTKKWSTVVTVTDATAPSRFAFCTKVGPMTVAEWVYDINPTADGAGCQVTETWIDGRNVVISVLGKFVTGVDDRVTHTKTMIETTLANLKQTAEAGS